MSKTEYPTNFALVHGEFIYGEDLFALPDNTEITLKGVIISEQEIAVDENPMYSNDEIIEMLSDLYEEMGWDTKTDIPYTSDIPEGGCLITRE